MAGDGKAPGRFTDDATNKMTEGSLTALAPAKINLTLHLCGQRDDGYHLLDSLVVFPKLGDRISVEPALDINLSISGPFGNALSDSGENLILRAAEAMNARAPGQGAAIRLDKRLPVASGIGGGSTDCAAALKLLSRLWDVDLPADYGLSLGADVPVCCAAPVPQRMRGIGDKLDAVGALPEMWIVLVNPGVAVPTGAVFAEVSDRSPAPGPDFPSTGFSSFAGLMQWMSACRNDLQAPAQRVCSQIGLVLEALADAPLARMSGSGGTCFALYPNRQSAESKAQELNRSTDWWIASAPVL